MATDNAKPAAKTDGEYGQMFPNWVYQVPGFVLIAVGFGGLLFLTLV